MEKSDTGRRHHMRNARVEARSVNGQIAANLHATLRCDLGRRQGTNAPIL